MLLIGFLLFLGVLDGFIDKPLYTVVPGVLVVLWLSWRK